MDLYHGRSMNSRHGETPTIVLYEQDSLYRQELVNYFAEKGGFRVLALEYLIQTEKQCLSLRPEAIIINPDGHLSELIETIKTVRANINIAHIPFYVMSSALSDSQKHILIQSGVRNIFERDLRIDIIYQGVVIKKGFEDFYKFDFSKPVELVAQEKLLPNNENCYYVLMQCLHQVDLGRLFKELFNKTLLLTWNWVVLEISCLEDLSPQVGLLIVEFRKRCVLKGLQLALVSTSETIRLISQKENIPLFKNYAAFEAQFKSSSANDIASMHSLDDLLSQIPD
jgi:hypothetical protein